MLKKYAKQLRQNGIERINVSLDTINPEKYNQITRFGNIEKVFDGINASLDEGIKIKINTFYNQNRTSVFHQGLNPGIYLLKFKDINWKILVR